MNHCATYIAEAKVKAGNPRMSDRELGELLGGYSQQNIARAKAGYMTDPMAVALARFLGRKPAEVVIVARAEREKDDELRQGLLEIVGKAVALLPSTVAGLDMAGGSRAGSMRMHRASNRGGDWRKRSVAPPRLDAARPTHQARSMRAFFLPAWRARSPA